MDFGIAALVFVAAYLLGSVSSARFVMRARDPGGEYQRLHREVEGSDSDFEGNTVSAASIGDRFGAGAGCLTALLDIGKAFIAVLVTLALFPDQSYHLVAGLGVIVGHILPIYHRFDGGAGMSTLLGSFVAIDPIGVVATQLAGMAIGIALGKALMLRWTGIILMIPWLWWRGGLEEGLFGLVANLLFWTAMIPELRQAVRFQSEGTLPDQQTIAELLQMGSFWRKVEPFSIPALIQRSRRR